MKTIWLLFFNCLAVITFAQNSAFDLIKDVNQKFKSVNSYIAQVQIKTDVSFIKMLPVQATIYFKQPDKLHLESKGIAMLPKQSPQFFLHNINQNDYLCIEIDKQIIDGYNCKGIKVIPLNEGSDLVLATLFIDPLNLVLRKAQITSRSNGTILMLFKYDKYLKQQLPDAVTFELDVAKFKIPKVVAADLENTKTNTDNIKNKRGTVTINYKSYQLNVPISDTFFEKVNHKK
ncbi:MAG: hypothetical protein JNK61_03655 [Bacteroidia bacterium]|nr:hypothetical protein [Bacteroidia bacterium]